MKKNGIIEKIEKTTNNKFLNLFKVHYTKEGGKEFVYEVCSRRSLENLEVLNPNSAVDAVKILPYFYKGGQLYVCLINEFRHALNKYLYSVPAGLVDEGETPMQSAIREVEEEIGAEVVNIEQICPASPTSAGLTDENLVLFNAEIKLTKQAALEEFEDISLKIVKFEDLQEFLNQNEFDLTGRLQLELFYVKQLLKQAKQTN